MSVLEVTDLQVEYQTPGGTVQAVDGVDLSVDLGRIVGVVGESGCGKTTLITAILDLLDDNGRITNGSIELNGRELVGMSAEELRREIRWTELAYIPQNAMGSLDPLYTVGDQVIQVIRTHTDRDRSTAAERVRGLMDQVGLDPERMHSYPHELSGGQRQRAVIVLALALEPAVVLADEPTTGLDVMVQDEILALLQDLQSDIGCSIVMVTHDMSVVAQSADDVVVMYGGRVMESGPMEAVFLESSHPYTIGLRNAFPSLARGRDMDLVSIEGSPPDLSMPPDGCRFAARCPFSTEECRVTTPDSVSVGDEHRVKCHYPDEADRFREEGQRADLWDRAAEVER